MTQLTDDCFATGDVTMTVDEAAALIAQRLGRTPRAVERVALVEADGRVLAQDVRAGLPLPPFANSAVDGYAVRHADLATHGATMLRVGARIEAGASGQALGPHEAARIFTGAPIPTGADTVFMQEDVRLEGDRVGLPPGLKIGANLRPAGEDVAQGALAIARGRRLTPQDIGLAAALGLTHLHVAQRLRVAVFSTGNELVDPGQAIAAPKLYDSNRFMLTTMLRRLGCDVSDLGVLKDDRATLSQALRAAARAHDLIVTSGGVSTGEADHVKGAVEDAGALTFWRLAIKPGRPVALGVVEGVPFVGLPGNPAASFIACAVAVRPAVLALMGGRYEPATPLRVRAAFASKKKGGRREYVRATLERGADGAPQARRFGREGAGLLSSLTQTHGLVQLAEDVTRVEPGDMVDYLDYACLF